MNFLDTCNALDELDKVTERASRSRGARLSFFFPSIQPSYKLEPYIFHDRQLPVESVLRIKHRPQCLKVLSSRPWLEGTYLHTYRLAMCPDVRSLHYQTDMIMFFFLITSRSSRAAAKRSFLDVEGGGEYETWSSEEDDGLDDRDSKGKKGKRSVRGASMARPRQRKAAAVNDLEAEAKATEAAVAQLAPKAEAWKHRYNALVSENEKLKRKLEIMRRQLALLNGVSSNPSLVGIAASPLPPPSPGPSR